MWKFWKSNLKDMSKKLLYTAVISATMFSTINLEGFAQVPSLANQSNSEATLIAQKEKETNSFIGVGHKTEGTYNIVTENGKQYLELNKSFRTDRGPDLFVLIHRQSVPQSYTELDFVTLDRLDKFRGSQRYLIPAHVDLTQFNSVVIWCREFNVTFGYAPLSQEN